MAASAEESAAGEEASEEEADESVSVSPSVSEVPSFFPLALVPLVGVVSAGALVDVTVGVEGVEAADEGDGCGAFGAGSLAASVKREEKLLPPCPDVEEDEEEKGSDEGAVPEAWETEVEPFGEREMGMRYSGWIRGHWNPIHRKYCPPSS